MLSTRFGLAGLALLCATFPAFAESHIAIIADYRGNVSDNNDNPARNRWDTGAVELNLRASMTPWADVIFVAPYVWEAEDELFFIAADAENDADELERGGEIEEAYVYLHDFGVPNLSARLGRFHLRFGKQNSLHIHELPTVDTSFMSRSFLGHEAIADNGASFSYALPRDEDWFEITLEVLSGEGNDEAGVFNNPSAARGPAFNAHFLWNRTMANDWNLEIGSSWLTGTRNDTDSQRAHLFGLDFTLSRPDDHGHVRTLIQAEAIYGHVESSPELSTDAFGAYLLAQQQLLHDWHLGCRVDWTQSATDNDTEVWGISPYITWQIHESLRLRAEYQHKAGDANEENTLYFQMTWVIGSHPSHQGHLK